MDSKEYLKEYFDHKLYEGVGLSPMGSGEDLDINLDTLKSLSYSDKSRYGRLLDNYYETLAELTEAVISSLDQIGIIPHIMGDRWIGTFNGALSVGDTAQLNISLSKDGMNSKNELILNIYKMPSGNYELNSYIS